MEENQDTQSNEASTATPEGGIVHATDATWEQEVLNSELPVLIDFWAEWCGPCHMIAPHVEKVSNELKGKLKVVKLDVDNNPQVAQRYMILSIPTLMLFKGGEAAGQIAGFRPAEQLLEWLGNNGVSA